jgi:cobalt-zinc-cadmium resistance protein CzcA
VVQKLIGWAVSSAFAVLLLVVVLAAVGGYSFYEVNVEAYPDPAPAIVEVVAQWPGYSAEEVERQVTIPLEVTLAGMPGLTVTRSKSLAGLSYLRNQFEYGVDYYAARQEIINRLAFVQGLPQGVQAQISPYTPTGELIRYVIAATHPSVQSAYALSDHKSLEDWTLEREFKRIPGVADVSSFGGTTKRYEICPDPPQLRRYGISVQQFQNAVANSNQNIGASFLDRPPNALNVRAIGLLGQGLDPMQDVLGEADPFKAGLHLRDEEQRRLQEIRGVVVTSVNNVPVRVQDLVVGGPVNTAADQVGTEGVTVGYQPRLGKVGLSRPRTDAGGRPALDDRGGRVWDDRDDVVQGIVLMRKYGQTLPTLQRVKDKVRELNEEPGRLPPGLRIDLHYDLTGMLNRTTETVRENLLMGMGLVTLVLLMFLSNVRSALIVAINVPLALLFAFSVLFLRGKSANLLSIGAVDFGIVVDSSVIMVENIYRHVSAGEHADLPLKERIVRASREVQRPLLFSTLIMVVAFIPLFTMQGPEGQIFAPMADTYAFALAGALLLALVLAPVLCLLLFKNLKPSQDNFLVRWLKRGYLRQLDRCLRHRYLTVGLFAFLAAGTASLLPLLGHEFMPELEEGNLYIRGTFLEVGVSLDEAADMARRARELIRSYPEVQLVESQVGRPDDGTDPTGYYNVEFSIPLIPEEKWPRSEEETSWWRRPLWGARRARTKDELIRAMNTELNQSLPGVDWNFSQYIRDNVMECLSGVKGDNSVKIIGPDLGELERLADQVKAALDGVYGIENVGVFRVLGQPNLNLHVDRLKCQRWGVSVADVQNAIKVAVGGNAVSQMVEGERTFDITLRWPERLRGNLEDILEIPVEVANNQVTPGNTAQGAQTPVGGTSQAPSASGTGVSLPAPSGSLLNAAASNLAAVPRIPLRHLVTPRDDRGRPDETAGFVRSGASTIYREQGRRLIAVKFSVRGRDLAGAVAEAQAAVAPLIPTPYRTEWSGDFEEMQAAEGRLLWIVPASLALIFLLLYMAFYDVVDALLVFSNVLALCMGGVWALLLTGTNFSVSAAVGFVSIFGVAIMDGLLLVSYFNQLRAEGLPLREAILQGAEKRVRPVMMTALTAVFGLLPAALSTRIGSQTQRPLAIVVVGGMVTTLFLTRYLMPVLYSFYGHRTPPAGAGGMAH